MSTHIPASANNQPLPPGVEVGIVAARFNAHIVDELLNGCLRRLGELGAVQPAAHVHFVPGAFELPIAAKWLAHNRRHAAVICLGCVIRGDTPHFDYVAGECARGIQQVGLELSLPIIFGVLTTDNEQQAMDRIGGSHGHAGEHAAEAAVEMIRLAQDLRK